MSVRAAQTRLSCRRLRALCTPAPRPSQVSCLRLWRRTLVCGSTRPSLCAKPSSSQTRTSGGQSQSTSLHLLYTTVARESVFLFDLANPGFIKCWVVFQFTPYADIYFPYDVNFLYTATPVSKRRNVAHIFCYTATAANMYWNIKTNLN